MPDGVKKGITVKVDAALHAEVTEYIRERGMTMSEFVAVALDNELHPKYDQKEGNNMASTRTVAFQVPEELFQRIKDYLNRNHMTQKQFLLGLIEQELDREQTARESQSADFEGETEPDEDDPDLDEDGAVDDFEGVSDDDEDEDEFDEETEDEDEEFDPADFDDDELGSFAVENDFIEDLQGLPDSALKYLDYEAIGQEQLDNDEGVFVDGHYVVTVDYESADVYDGKHIPPIFRRYIHERCNRFR